MLSTYISNTKAVVASSVILGAALVYKACNIICRMNPPTLSTEPAIAKPSREGQTVVAMDTTTGERNGLDYYVVGGIIGSGSYSQVFRAENLKSKRVIALKKYKMKKEHHLYEKAAAEMAFLRFLNHEHIIKFIACDIKKENMYLATEYSEFGSFTKIIHQVDPIPEEFIQLVMKQLISALSYLHSMHIVHGDVKPENIIISHFCPTFTIKLNDFGLSEVLHREFRITKAGSFFYMAPELHLSAPSDSTADLYSAGVVMYELIYGKKPFPTNITEDSYIAMLITQVQITYPEERTAELSTKCMNLLKGLLSFEKDKRHFGNTIVHHPFLEIGDIFSNQDHYNEGYKCLIKSIDLAKKQLYGTAYIEVTQAILHFKIHCKSVIPDMPLYAFLRSKIVDYTFFSKKIKNLMLTNDDNFVEPFFMPMQVEKLRCMLTSVPHLLAAYDLCLIGEMCIAKTDKRIGLLKLRDGLNELSAILPEEPDSEHKNLLLKKHAEWTHDLKNFEANKKEPLPESED